MMNLVDELHAIAAALTRAGILAGRTQDLADIEKLEGGDGDA